MNDMVFGSRYRAIEKIGSGGMADVYKAMDEVLGRTVAVKVMHAHFADDPTFVQRFRHEAQAAGNLSHPNIVNIYDWGQQDDTYYIVMEYIRGISIKELVTQRGPVDPLKAADYAAQVCAGLSVAHGYGIIHRDIKSHNLVLMADGTVKVMDFGIARAVNSTMTQTGSVLGTAQYVSPEQAQGRELTPGTDLYSLGIVLYEMTTGRLPFEGDTPVSVALKHVNEAAIPPRQVNPSIPPAVEAVILRAMEKDPARRYTSAEQMRGDLLRAAEGRAVAAMPRVDDTTVMPAVQATGRQPETRRTEVPQRRSTNVWIWVGVAALLIVLGIGVAWALGLIGGSVNVPDVTKMTEAEARTVIEDAGLVVGNVDTRPDDVIPAGEVISTDPPIGTAMAKGETVDLTTSGGPVQVEIPKVVDMTEDEAATALQAEGFSVDPVVAREFNAADVGTVYRQDPPAGTKASKGTPVKLYVSKGLEEVGVPYVVEMTKAAAIDRLHQAGFKVKPVPRASSDVPTGTVMDQKPAGGLTAPKNSEVVIYVSSGPKKISVPDLRGLTEGDAKAQLESLLLTYEVDYVDEPDPAKVGRVNDQLPAAGSKVVEGTMIKLQVGVTP